MKVDKQLILLAVSSLAVLALGSAGFYTMSPDNGVLTSAYLAVQLFSMNSGVVDEVPTPMLIEIARWLALGTLLVAVHAAARALLVHFQSAMRISAMSEHSIVCGAGQRGEALARALSRHGHVVVIESNELCPALGDLKNLGVEIVIGNAVDSAVLRQAGVSRARNVVAVTGTDETNLGICAEVTSKLNRHCALSAGLESWAWRNYFLDRLPTSSKIRLDSYISRATQSLMLSIGLEAARDPILRIKGVTLLIEAGESRLQELVRSAIMIIQVSGEKKLRLELTATNARQQKEFCDRFPSASIVADINWHDESASMIFPEGSEMRPDFAVFACESDIESLELTERYWMRHEIDGQRVIACLRGNSDATYMDLIRKKHNDIRVENLLPLGLGNEYPLDTDIERKAKLCHAIYSGIAKPEASDFCDTDESWSQLSERLKESNRLVARHNEIKRVAWGNLGSVPSAEMLSFLSRCEHMRWMAEKAMDGWRWSGSYDSSSRNNEKLKHHLLVPFDSLSNRDVEKDYSMFLWALDLEDNELDQLNLTEKAREMIRLHRDLSGGKALNLSS